MISWVLGERSVSSSDTLNTPMGMCSLVKKKMEIFINWNHEMSLFWEKDFPQWGDISLDLDLFEIDEYDISIAPLQPIPQVEDDHKEFHPSRSEKNIQIPQER